MVFPLFFFGPISYYSYLQQNIEKEPVFEVNDNFIKQSYRNRCYILGSNKQLCLTIPVKHKHSSKLFKDTQICYDFDWVKLHLKSYDSAYRNTPYYEYFEDSFKLLYSKKEVYLLDFLLSTFNWTSEKLQLDLTLNKTLTYKKEYLAKDLRHSFIVNKKTELEKDLINNLKPYYQILGNESEFVKNLSILDLIFNCGNTSLTYLNK